MEPTTLIAFLTWAAGILGAALVGVLVWFLLRYVALVDKLLQQGSDFEVRLVAMETWQRMVSTRRSDDLRGIS